MLLKHLSLVNFKNISEANISFNERVVCFLGNNGQGKTNILDAIHYLSYCKSHFNSIDSQNIKFDDPFFVIQGQFEVEENMDEVYCGFKRGQKKVVKKNKKAYSKLADHIGQFPVVIITPYDSNLVLEASEIRRKFLDAIISQFDKLYLSELIAYNKILQQRNALLKQFAESGRFQEDLLSIINEQLANKGQTIFNKRREFLKDFIPVFNNYYKEISQGQEEVDLAYQSSLHEESMLQLLESNVAKDRVLTYTSIGIHKDDLEFRISGHPLKKFGSQGQQKSFLIALKLAKYDYIKQQKGVAPILLLDDIFDKLDEHRVEYILKLISNHEVGQTFITDTSISKVPETLSRLDVKYNAFRVEGGEIDSLFEKTIPEIAENIEV